MAKRTPRYMSPSPDPVAAELEALMTGIEPMVIRLVEELHDPDKAVMLKNLQVFFDRAKQVPLDGSLMTVLGLDEP